MFSGMKTSKKVRQIALVGFGSKKNRTSIGGGEIVLIADLLVEILADLQQRPMHSQAVPEQFGLLRALQFVASFKKHILARLDSNTEVPILAWSTEPQVGVANPLGPCASCPPTS